MSRVKILIVEDDSVLLEFYNQGLPEEEYDKRFSLDGIDALNIYASWKPEIIILDIGLPEVDGFSVLKKIREEFKDKETLIIMITGDSNNHKINDCIKLGISDYVVKPFRSGEDSNPSRFEEIRSIVNKVLKEKCHMENV